MSENKKNIQRLAGYVSKNPDDSFSKFALALELLKNNQGGKALVLFESIYERDPDYLGIYYHLGKLYQDLHRGIKAETCFREGIDLAEKQNERQTLSELKEALRMLEEEKKT
ncbi:MAG: hypothetical protein WD317_02865 [Balneolaceae bacterium]